MNDLDAMKRREQQDLLAIQALDWATCPMTREEHIAVIESGRLWNDFIRSRQEPRQNSPKTQPKNGPWLPGLS
jgi:hypothetical protein